MLNRDDLEDIFTNIDEKSTTLTKHAFLTTYVPDILSKVRLFLQFAELNIENPERRLVQLLKMRDFLVQLKHRYQLISTAVLSQNKPDLLNIETTTQAQIKEFEEIKANIIQLRAVLNSLAKRPVPYNPSLANEFLNDKLNAAWKKYYHSVANESNLKILAHLTLDIFGFTLPTDKQTEQDYVEAIQTVREKLQQKILAKEEQLNLVKKNIQENNVWCLIKKITTKSPSQAFIRMELNQLIDGWTCGPNVYDKIIAARKQKAWDSTFDVHEDNKKQNAWHYFAGVPKRRPTDERVYLVFDWVLYLLGGFLLIPLKNSFKAIFVYLPHRGMAHFRNTIDAHDRNQSVVPYATQAGLKICLGLWTVFRVLFSPLATLTLYKTKKVKPTTTLQPLNVRFYHSDTIITKQSPKISEQHSTMPVLTPPQATISQLSKFKSPKNKEKLVKAYLTETLVPVPSYEEPLSPDEKLYRIKG